MFSGRSFSTAQRWNIAIIIIILVGVTFFGPLRKTDSMTLDVSREQVALTGPSGAPFTVTVAYEDILSISETDTVDPGVMLNGLNQRDCRFGSWRNDAYGEYTLCDTPAFPEHIVLETVNGAVVFNYESANFTHELYLAMQEVLSNSGGMGE